MCLGMTPCRRQRRESGSAAIELAQVVVPLTSLTGARIAGAHLIALSTPNCSVPVLRQ